MRKNNVKIVTLLLVIVLISGCGFLKGIFSGKTGNDPKEVAQKFWDASKSGNIGDMLSFSTKSSAAMLQKEGDQNSMKKSGDFILSDAKVTGDTAIVPTSVTTDGFTMNLETKLVKEDGTWKVDAESTIMSMFGGAMEEAMKQMGDQMGKALEKGSKQIGEAIGNSMNRMGDTLNDGAQAMKDTMEGSNEKIVDKKTSTEPTDTASIGNNAFAVGSEVLVEWGGKWWPAKVLKAQDDKWYIHYDGYGAEWDEWVGTSRVKLK